MLWRRLKDFKCPKCNTQLEHQLDHDRYVCTDKDCDFKIGKKKFNSVVTSLHKPKYEEPDFVLVGHVVV